MKRSLQECREAIASNFRAMQAVDGAFFANINERLDAFQAKNAHPADFRRLHSEVAAWAQKLTNSVGKWSEQDQAAYDGALAVIDMITIEIENRAAAVEALNGRGFARNQSSGYVNAENGEPVRMYASDEQTATDSHTRIGAPSVGALIAAKLVGTSNPEIRNTLSEGTDSAGGYSVPAYVLPQFIDKLRAKTQMINAGARTLMLETKKTTIVRLDTDATAAWRSENGALTASDPVLSGVDFVPQDLHVLVKLSRELFADSINIQNIIERTIVGAMSVELDRAGMFGSGTLPEPLGLFNTTGIGSVILGTGNGATPSNYDDLLDLLYALESNNTSPTAMIWNPRTARTYRKMKTTTNEYLEAPAPLDTLAKLDTNSVPINQTVGTATACSTVLMGDFTQAIVGIREGLNIRFLTEKYADNGQYAFVAHLRADFAFEHPASFAAMTGIKP